LREENLAVVTRKIAEDAWVTNLDGTKSRAVSWCKCCRVYKPLSAFYLKSKSTRKHKNDVRGNCCLCFDTKNKIAKEIREERNAFKELNTWINNFNNDLEQIRQKYGLQTTTK
jgi:tryptophanyl-tRNA synthetase